jgi:hypothetical protein
MRNRALHDALRDFALEAAALLTEELKAGAEVEFDVVEEGVGAHRAPPGASPRQGAGRGPALYRYEPRTGAFIEERWPQLRELPTAERACRELGAGASAWLRVNGLRGEQAEPALRAMLERLYEDATSFGFPEERFERVYGEVELTLYRDAVRARVIAPVHAAWMDAERIELGDGLSLMRGDALEGPHDRATLLCVLERDVPADDPIPADEASERFAEVVTALRLWAPGGVALGSPGWRQADHARWQPVAIGSAMSGRGPECMLRAGDEQAFREFYSAIRAAQPPANVAWALARFEMGCAQGTTAEALSDYLLGLRALLDATTETGHASFGLRLAALCAEEDARRELQERMEAAFALERFVMGGSGGVRVDAESPRELIAEIEGHLRALLRDVLCGYLDADLRSVADDILLESQGEPLGEIEARDLRMEPEPEFEPELDEQPSAPRFERAPDEEPMTFEPELEAEYDVEPDTAEMEPVAVTPEPMAGQEPTAVVQDPVQHQLDGVTGSADWGWDDPEDFSAPV